MTHVSRPLLGLLVATVAVFALWIVALKPSASTSGHSGPQGLGQYQSAVNAAHGAVGTANQASAQNGGVIPSGSGATSSAPAKTTAPAKLTTGGASSTSSTAAAASKSVSKRAADAATVIAALRAHKAVAVLFYNPAAPDDQAVKHELVAVPTHGGRVVKLAVPLTELTSFPVITNQVPIDSTPTLVLIDRHQQASTIVGYASGFEIAQRVADALN